MNHEVINGSFRTDPFHGLYDQILLIVKVAIGMSENGCGGYECTFSDDDGPTFESLAG